MSEVAENAPVAEAPRIASWTKLVRILIVGAVVGALAVAAFLLPVRDTLVAGLEWTRGLGVWGPIFVVGFYIVACVFLLPGSALTIGSGFLFGVVVGTITVSIGSTLGACAAFIVGRTVARNWIEQKVTGRPRFAAIDEAVGREGFKIVLLTRLSPIFPFNFQNYAYGLTKVPLTKYALASWIGMLPGTIMYVYIGSAARSLAEVAAGTVESSSAQRIFFWVGLAATVAVAVLVTRIARKALNEAVASTERTEDGAGRSD
ncbi:MAG: TVP38/TMEM64 family protein [Phycisphaerae bacterium]|nr:TVP38/TMEM64 family protein [Phycisphaerae bacterium]